MFQKRFEGSVDFYLSWNDYKYGFGDVNGEFWLGLEKIHALTPDDNNMLRVDLEDFGGNTRYAEYNMFDVTSENDKCKLNLGSYSCNIMKFSPPTTHKRIINVIGITKELNKTTLPSPCKRFCFQPTLAFRFRTKKSPSNPNLLYMVVIIVSSSSTLNRAIEIKIKRVCNGLLFPGDLDPSSLTLGGSVVLLVCGFMKRDNSWRGASCLRKSRLN